MKKFAEFPKITYMNRVNGLRSLLLALGADDRERGVRVVWPAARAASRMFLDMPGFTQSQIFAIVKQAVRLGLVKEKFLNPYIVGHGEMFIGLSEKGVKMVDRT